MYGLYGNGKGMTEVEILTEQIIALEPLIDEFKFQMVVLFLGLIVGLIVGMVILLAFADSNNSGMKLVGAIFLGLGIVSGVALFTTPQDTPYLQQEKLENQRSDLIKTQIRSLDCEGLRLDILKKLEDDDIEEFMKEHDEFEKTYYYHKCEIPLREEVIRLQK